MTHQFRVIDTGLRDGRSREITSGVEPGDALILHADETIADGTRVRPLE